MEAFIRQQRKKEIREVLRLVQGSGASSLGSSSPQQEISQCNETFGSDLSSEKRSGLRRHWHARDGARAIVSNTSSYGSALTFVRRRRPSILVHLRLPETV